MKILVKITRQENADFFQTDINSIVEVDFEEYIAAVVASEIGNSNIEACKAQAVAARSYAVYTGVLLGKVISDDSSVAQAYRAKRYNENIYPNCIKAAKATKGEVLYYNNKVALTVYSSSNGGRTVSYKEHWGSQIPYLIAQDDPWDTYTAHGHGVGMSQKGAIYAGNNGFNYKQILAFYYPNTQIKENYGIMDLVTKVETIQTIHAQIKKIQSELLNLQTELDEILNKF